MHLPGIDEAAAEYFSTVVLQMLRATADTGQLILQLHAELERVKLVDGLGGVRAGLIGVALLAIEARTRKSLEALQAAIDTAYTLHDMNSTRGNNL